MARKNPVGKLAETALSTLKAPKAAAEKVVDQAKGTVALGRTVAGTAGSMAGSVAGTVAGTVVNKATGRGRRTPVQVTPPSTPARPDLRSVPRVNEPAHTQPTTRQPAEAAKKHGDVLETPTATRRPAAKAPAKKATAKKAPAKKAPVKKAAGPVAEKAASTKEAEPTPVRVPTEPDVAAKKAAEEARAAKTAATKKATAKKAPAKKTPAKKVAATPADVAEVVESKSQGATSAEATGTGTTKKSATKAPAKKSPAKRTTANKAPAKKTAGGPGAKLPVKKAAAEPAPKTAEEVVEVEGREVMTPAGTTGAAPGYNPDTAESDLTQPGTEPLLDESTVKSVASESEQLRQAAEKSPE